MENPGISVACKTEKGRRPSNEDACLVLTAEKLGGGYQGLFIVADGMGGRASGAIASEMAAGAVRDAFVWWIRQGETGPEEILRRSLQAANDVVWSEATSKPELDGMGTTCMAVAIRNGWAYFAHMGDSRAYLLRDGRLRRLTEDHSFVAEKVKSGEITEEQARKSRFRNIITRAVGLEPEAHPDVGSVELREGDVLLLCTDGLTGPLRDPEIEHILSTSPNAEKACERMVGSALRSGGSDNVTSVVVGCGPGSWQGDRSARQPEAGRRPRVSPALPLLLGLVLGVGLAMFPGRMLLSRLEKPPAGRISHVPAQPDLAHVEYRDPVSLLYTPLRGKFLALDRHGFIYVVDRQGRLLRADTAGQVVYIFPARDALLPPEEKPSSMLAADSQGNLYISNPSGKRIEKWGRDGLFLGSIGDGKLSGPEALAVDDNGDIYVIDSGRLKAIRRADKNAGAQN